MNQRVPSWDLDDYPAAVLPAGAHRVASAGAFTSPGAVPMSDQYCEVAELTWEKGNISSHGLLNRPVAKYPPPSSAQLQPIGGGGVRDHRETLEAVVGEAAARSSTTSHLAQPAMPAVPAAAVAPWLGVVGAAALQRAAVDALVPCARVDESETGDDARISRKRARVVVGHACASQGSAAPGRGESTLDHACGTDADDLCGFTTTTNNSTWLDRDDDDDKDSPETENTSTGGGAASDSTRFFSHRFQRGSQCDEEEHDVVIKGGAAMRPSISTKRSRAAAIHNESERKRRDRINQKMKTLQKLVPNSSKTDKASMLDEVIDYLKQMQAQVQVMSRMSSMMMPMAMPQLQMSFMANMAQMAQMAQMGLGMMNMGSLAQPGYTGLTPPMMHAPPPPPFVPMSWDANASPAAGERSQPPPAGSAPPDAFLACQAAQQNAQQQQPSSMEAYNRMVAMYQRVNQQQQQSSSKQ